VGTIIRSRFPDLLVRGENYPAPQLNQYLAQAVGYLQFAGMGLMFAGDYIFQQGQEPSFYLWMRERKLVSILVMFLLGNNIATGLVSTGAFEVYLDGRLIWSKLESGRIPDADELLFLLKQELKKGKWH